MSSRVHYSSALVQIFVLHDKGLPSFWSGISDVLGFSYVLSLLNDPVSVDSDVQRKTKLKYYWEWRVSKASRRQLPSRHSPGGWGRPRQTSISVSTRHFPNLIVPSCFVFGKCRVHISTWTSVTTHVFVFSISHSNKTLELNSSRLRPVPHPPLLIIHWTPYHVTKQAYSLSYAQRIVMYHTQTNEQIHETWSLTWVSRNLIRVLRSCDRAS